MKLTTRGFKKASFLIFFISFLTSISSGYAQTISVNDAADPEAVFSPEDLIRNILIDGDCANVDNISSLVNGNPDDVTTKSYGYFRRQTDSRFPFKEGIILTTGNAFNSSNPATPDLGTDSGTGGDADLLAAIPGGGPFSNATVFEFDFVPVSNTISFRYLMASEEYETAQGFPCDFADSFAFLLRQEGTTAYDNIAVLPDGTTPVSVVNVHAEIPTSAANGGCPAENETFFQGYDLGDTNFGGRTVVLTATATVIPNTTYHIKLVIADAVDTQFDSAVFLEAGSFNLGLDLGDDFVTADNTAVCGSSIPLMANIVASSYQWLKDGVAIPGATDQTYNANLGDGTYTCEISISSSCIDSDDIFLEFVDAATINPTISNFQICDVDGDLMETFDLTSRDTEILNGQDPAIFEVQYFSDAAYTTLIPSPTAHNNTSPTETIYARVVNRNSTNCIADGSFTIEVTGIPIPTAPIDYEICDNADDGDDTNGFVDRFLLSTKDVEILGSLDPAQYNVSYHTTLVGAETSNSTDVINKNVLYTNTIINIQPIYVRVENVGNVDCNDTSIAFNLIVSELPTTTAAVELRQCDTDIDGFSDFNLNEAATDISDNFINETFVFYPTLLDAQNDTNAISAADAIVFTNRTVTTDIVWARAISTFGCYRISEVTLIVSTTGIPATFQRNFENCDDFLDINGDDNIDNDDTDGVATFDFSGVDIQIRNLFPPTQALTITYYRNQADALAELNAITDTANYRNIGYPNSQQIYVRVDSDLDNDCLGFGPHITLTVDPVPTATDVSNLELCDNLDDGDGFNGIVQTFDLESQTPLILGTQNPADYTVTYHTTAADANAGVAAITTSGMYTNTVADLQTIYVRVTNNTTLCFTDHTSFDLIVNPLPVANFVQDLEICDDDSDGSAQNGFSQSFDLELQTPGVLGTQDPAIFSVTYHASLADAQAGILPLGSPFSNSVPFSQIIYVRVFNSATQCANGISNFNAIVNPEPTTENVSNLSYCDDATDGDDTNGFIQNIDLDSQILGILGPLQDEDDFTVTFHETAADASSGNSPLSSPYSNTVAGQQTIYVRVLNDDTLCVNDDFTFDVIVNPLPDFQVTTPQIVCLNGPPLTIRVENPAAVYDYVWTDPNGNMIAGVSEITITSGGLYTITASTTDGTTDENGVSCARVRTIQVDESIIATITDDDVIIVDDNDNNSITIDPTNLGIGDYEYALINEDNGQTTPFQDDPLFENLEGGFYTILVRDKNGCGTASLLVSVVVFPKFFTPNNDGVNDTWAIKGANSTFFPSSQIHIFNRFGKVIAEIDIDNPGWNGTFNGKALPSDDYWFSIILVPANTNRPPINRKGNFAMLRNRR